jgi:sterol desaturase/sphingolipid hydroxylase (fatty acid hydroxylase superfamily)
MNTPLFGINHFEILVLGGFFLALLVLGAFFPLRTSKRAWFPRAIINGIMSAAAFVAGTFVVRPVSLGLSQWSEQSSFGLLNLVPMHPVIVFAAGFLLLDLTFYYWHRANHELGLLWRFHNVHHSDPDMDVTTSFRFHFVEVLYSTLFRIAQVGIIGVAPATYLAYELVFQCGTVFHHSNVRLPIQLERLLNNVIVTPRMHGIHHSDIQCETDSNYSVVFRWWDKIHSSLRLNLAHDKVNIGVAGYQEPEDNAVMALLAAPLRKQKEYWVGSDGEPSVRDDGEYSGPRGVLAQ